jgi:hypothetical protein
VEGRLAELPAEWGPVGSTSYELATGLYVIRDDSDLDFVIYAREPMEREMAQDLFNTLKLAPAKVDVRIETPWILARGVCSRAHRQNSPPDSKWPRSRPRLMADAAASRTAMNTGLLFPGQVSQKSGVLDDLVEHPTADESLRENE